MGSTVASKYSRSCRITTKPKNFRELLISVNCVDLKMLRGVEIKAITVERPKVTTVQNQRSTYFDWVSRMFSTSANDVQNQPPSSLDATPEVSTPETSNPDAVEDVRNQLSILLDTMMFKMLSTSNPNAANEISTPETSNPDAVEVVQN